jgi:hypothetical protein
MSLLVDSNKRTIPVCNVQDEQTGAFYYVGEESQYDKYTKAMKNAKNFTIVGGAVLALLLCIFSLNFQSGGWTAGNLMTFGIVVAALLGVLQYGKTWNESWTMLSQLQIEGTPCYSDLGQSKQIFCSGS